MKNDIAKTQYGFNPFKNMHSINIVGSTLQTMEPTPEVIKNKEH